MSDTTKTAIDFRTCPLCGEELMVHMEERIYGYQRPALTVDRETGDLTKAEWGITEPDWESSRTIQYLADCCNGGALPEEYQQELDRALGNERQFYEYDSGPKQPEKEAI